jgi:outer membrane protein assembly factor BamB
MKSYITLTICVAAIVVCGFDWPQFRGPGGISSTTAILPTTFNDTENVAWKVPLPGRGPASPIVVGNQVIVSSSSGDKEDQLFVTSFDIETGKQLWEQRLWATGRCFCHPLSANAAPTPASDGKYIYAFYSSNDLACIDLKGNLIWYRALAVDHPKAGNDVGMSSSITVIDGVVIAQVENQGDSFATGLNCETGETVWEIERDDVASWASPVVFQEPGGKWLATLQGAKGLSIVEVRTGNVLEQIEGECSTVTSAAVIDNMVYAPLNGTTAYRVSSGGTMEKAWDGAQIRAANASAVVHDGTLYTLNRTGVLAGFSAETGKPTGLKLRVGGSYWGTPAIAGQHMYFFAQDGTARVVKLGDDAEVVHEHKFEDEVFLCSPAVTDQGLFVRSDKHLWKIADGE